MLCVNPAFGLSIIDLFLFQGTFPPVSAKIAQSLSAHTCRHARPVSRSSSLHDLLIDSNLNDDYHEWGKGGLRIKLF
jgi:hypothetical protein